jgi:hypothetical protein
MAEDREPFLKRWARLKSEGPTPQEEEPRPAAASEPVAGAAEPKPVRPEDLPPIEELTADSDFTPFLQAGVPEELKRLALRKLWRSDPVLANLDGLVEYGEDFGAAFRNPGPVATLFRIGRGMPGPGDLEDEPAEAEPAAEQTAAEAAEKRQGEPFPAAEPDPEDPAASEEPPEEKTTTT